MATETKIEVFLYIHKQQNVIIVQNIGVHHKKADT